MAALPVHRLHHAGFDDSSGARVELARLTADTSWRPESPDDDYAFAADIGQVDEHQQASLDGAQPRRLVCELPPVEEDHRFADGQFLGYLTLVHTGGVDSPPSPWADSVADVADMLGSVVGCSGPRGEFAPSTGGYAVLGQLIADLTGTSFAQAATRLVLEPLGMADSWFPAEAPVSPDAACGYRNGRSAACGNSVFVSHRGRGPRTASNPLTGSGSAGI